MITLTLISDELIFQLQTRLSIWIHSTTVFPVYEKSYGQGVPERYGVLLAFYLEDE